MQLPRKIQIQSPIKDLRVERSNNNNAWCIWLAGNATFSCGTFLSLCDDGSIKRITIHPDGTETILEIT